MRSLFSFSFKRCPLPFMLCRTTRSRKNCRPPSLKSVRVQTTRVHHVGTMQITPTRMPMPLTWWWRINPSRPHRTCIVKFPMLWWCSTIRSSTPTIPLCTQETSHGLVPTPPAQITPGTYLVFQQDTTLSMRISTSMGPTLTPIMIRSWSTPTPAVVAEVVEVATIPHHVGTMQITPPCLHMPLTWWWRISRSQPQCTCIVKYSMLP